MINSNSILTKFGCQSVFGKIIHLSYFWAKNNFMLPHLLIDYIENILSNIIQNDIKKPHKFVQNSNLNIIMKISNVMTLKINYLEIMK